MAKKTKLVFACKECGYNSPKWMGKCSGCGAWNSFVEELDTSKVRPSRRAALNTSTKPQRINEVQPLASSRIPTGILELDRVLGGGFVPGTAVLLAGDPGIGKSTLTLQAAHKYAQATGRAVLYVTGEESAEQVKLRAERLDCLSNELF
ncbi:MAG: AAA family ATPase, partial [Planctomycetes bacterium]|nr:AAA family ATPase [Planctomycetota bacterium]